MPEMHPGKIFRGHVAVVTGASSGIGRAIARSLGREGAIVCAVGRNYQALTETVKVVEVSGGQGVVFEADLAAANNFHGLAHELEQRFHRLEILVHSAGLMVHELLRNAHIENFDLQYQTNVRGPYLLTQAVLPLLKLCRGQIVFINSSAGLAARAAHVGQYAGTKHALKAIADSLREEVNADGIRVLSVYPGRTATPIQEKLFRAEGKPYHPERLLQPEDVASVVLHALGLPRTAEVTDISIRPMQKF